MFGAEVAKNAAGAAVHEGFDVSAGKAIQPSSGARGFGGGAGGGGFGGVYGEKPVVLSDEALVAEAKKPVVVATGQIATKQDRAGLSFSQTDAIASRRKLSLSTAEANSLGRDNLQTASKGMHWDRGISKALKESDSEDATAPAKPDSNGQPLEVTINRQP